MIMIVPTSSPVNSGFSVRRVPAVAGDRLLLREGAGQREDGHHGQEPAEQHGDAMVVLNHWVSALSLANAEPLLFAPEV